MPRVSVVIPCYNQGQYIRSTLDSVLAQTYNDVEIIVVDDGSTDNTRDQLSSYMERIQYIRQPNKGLSGARNTGFQASSGEYVMFLDSDDRLRPDALALMVASLERQADCGLVYCAWQQISSDGQRVLGEVHPGQQGDILKKLLLREFFFFASAALLRRPALERVGLFDETLPWGEDADMWLRLARAGYTFAYLDEPVLQYRVHTGSMTAAVTSRQIQGWHDGLRKFFSDPTLPEAIRRLEPQARRVLHFETAGRYFRAGDVDAARQQLLLALQAEGTVEADWFLNWVAGTTLDPRTTDPDTFLNLVFTHLPAQAGALKRLQRRARGRYHTAALFAAHSSGHHDGVRSHWLPAIVFDPRVLLNKGFLRITFVHLFGYRT